MLRKVISGFLISTALSGMALADGPLALMIGNHNYADLRDVPDAEDIFDLRNSLSGAGFDVLAIRNINDRNIGKLSSTIVARLEAADRVLILVGGHVVSAGGDTWLLNVDAPRKSAFLGPVPGISIDGLVELASGKSGAAIVAIGQSTRSVNLNRRLSYGPALDDIPQGVTLVSGFARDLPVVAQVMSRAGAVTTDLIHVLPEEAVIAGFVSSTAEFTPQVESSGGGEAAAWANAVRLGNKEAVSDYLKAYPNGEFVDEAEAMLAELNKTPTDYAREAEDELRLTRDEKRSIQQDLTLLGYDTRGIDGIFGRGSRGAIARWQADNRYDALGYLTDEQIKDLQDQAADRSYELEQEAIQKKLEEERADAKYWRSTGQDGSEAGLRAYLKRYPDGLYSELAAARLEVFDEQNRQKAAAAERAAWDQASEVNTVAGYRAFLKAYPNGAFVDAAQTRLDALLAQDTDNAALEAAAAAEAGLLSNPITRALIERQLNALGFKPGPIDGRFDDATRKALRNFQRAMGLKVTGYADQATIVRILGGKTN